LEKSNTGKNGSREGEKMNVKKQFASMLHVVVLAVLIIQMTACGYFLYPERRGQRHVGRIDPAIAVLDALGLIFFIVPGVIAFAVDITNGTLYLPGSHHHSSASTEKDHIKVIRVNPGVLNEKMIQELVKHHTGISIRLDQRNVEIYELNRSENIEAKLVELGKSGYRRN
jgi:hypothetical protein